MVETARVPGYGGTQGHRWIGWHSNSWPLQCRDFTHATNRADPYSPALGHLQLSDSLLTGRRFSRCLSGRDLKCVSDSTGQPETKSAPIHDRRISLPEPFKCFSCAIDIFVGACCDPLVSSTKSGSEPRGDNLAR